MKQLTVLTLLIFSPFVNHAQISSGKVEDAKKKDATEAGKAAKDPSEKYDPETGMMDFTAAAQLVASAAKAHSELGWRPRYPDLATIIQHAWAWHQRR